MRRVTAIRRSAQRVELPSSGATDQNELGTHCGAGFRCRSGAGFARLRRTVRRISTVATARGTADGRTASHSAIRRAPRRAAMVCTTVALRIASSSTSVASATHATLLRAATRFAGAAATTFRDSAHTIIPTRRWHAAAATVTARAASAITREYRATGALVTDATAQTITVVDAGDLFRVLVESTVREAEGQRGSGQSRLAGNSCAERPSASRHSECSPRAQRPTPVGQERRARFGPAWQ